MHARGITSITLVNDLGTTPARVNRLTGEMQFSKIFWKKLTPEQRAFVLLHEHAHAELNTTNEFEADKRAFELYAKSGLSLKKSVEALTGVLPFSNKEHLQRAYAQYQRARLYDLNVYGNQKARTDLLRNNKTMSEIFNTSFAGNDPDLDVFTDFDGYDGYDGEDEDSFLGLGKKGRERRAEKRETKNQQKIAKKTAIIAARGDARAKVASAGGGTAGLGAGISGLFNSVKDKLTGGGSEVIEPGVSGGQGAPANNNKMLLIAGAVVAIIVVVVILKRK